MSMAVLGNRGDVLTDQTQHLPIPEWEKSQQKEFKVRYSAFVLQFSLKHPWTKITSCDQAAQAQLPKEAVALSKPPCHTAGHLGSAANEHIQLAEADFAQQLFTQATSLHTAAFPPLQELQHLHLGCHPQGILLYPKTNPFQHQEITSLDINLFGTFGFKYLQDPSHPSSRLEGFPCPNSAGLKHVYDSDHAVIPAQLKLGLTTQTLHTRGLETKCYFSEEKQKPAQRFYNTKENTAAK